MRKSEINIVLLVLCGFLIFISGYMVSSYNKEPIIKELTGNDLTKFAFARDTITLMNYEGVRPFVNDILNNINNYPKKISFETNRFYGHGFEIWIFNGKDYLSLLEPERMDFTKKEKELIWNVYSKLLKESKEKKDKEFRINH
jgi:hypothetical protein